MASNLSDQEWKTLLRRIRNGNCTAFLGAGVNDGILPLGKDIAREWAKEYEYPLGDCADLVRVAQFMAVTNDFMNLNVNSVIFSLSQYGFFLVSNCFLRSK